MLCDDFLTKVKKYILKVVWTLIPGFGVTVLHRMTKNKQDGEQCCNTLRHFIHHWLRKLFPPLVYTYGEICKSGRPSLKSDLH